MEQLSIDDAAVLEEEERRKKSLEVTIASNDKQLRELTSLRLRSMIDDDEFARERRRIESEQLRLKERLSRDDNGNQIELFGGLFSFSKQAIFWFLDAKIEDKRLLMKTVISNSTLSGKKVSFEAAKPFLAIQNSPPILQLCPVAVAHHED